MKDNIPYILILIALILLFSCKKELNSPVKPPQPSQHIYICKNWEGTWWNIGGDSLIKDSLIIKFDKQENNITFYKSNIEYLNNILFHKCPYEQKDENLTLIKNNKKFIFRHD